MKTKEKLAQDFAKKYKNTPDIFHNNYEIYLAGFEKGFAQGQAKWSSVSNKLPEDDGTVLVWIYNIENPQWSNYGLCSYIDGKWYCKGGRKSHEIVTDWCQIPARKK